MHDPEAASAPDSGLFGLDTRPEEAGCVVIPVGFDATTSYRDGTRRGPEAILRASRQLDLFSLAHGRPYEAGIAMLATDPRVTTWNARARRWARPVIEAGGGDPGSQAVRQVTAIQEQLRDWLRERCSRGIGKGQVVGVVGGEHSISLGAIAAHAERWPGLGILHVDAHHDLRVAFEGLKYSHASIMDNVLDEVPGVARLVSVGIRDFSEKEHDRAREDERVTTFYQEQLDAAAFGGRSWAEQCAAIVEGLPEHVYVSFDIDGLDPALCPSTGTPVPGGLGFAQAVFLLRAACSSGRRLVGFDLVEVAPGRDDWDGNVGARLLYELIALALAGRP